MSDYISREAINQIIAAQCGECADACLEFDGIQPDCNQCLLHGAKKAIESIPATDFRLVVLCRDCRSYNKPRLGFCETHLVRMHRDDYCSYGKKREEI